MVGADSGGRTGRAAGGAGATGAGSGSMSWASSTGGSGVTQTGTIAAVSPTMSTWSMHDAAIGPSRVSGIRASHRAGDSLLLPVR